MSKIRTFLAIPIRGIVSLENWITHLKSCDFSERIKWNDCEDWHLTLKFIGDIDEIRMEILKKSLKAELHGFPSGQVEVCGTGFFGMRENPKVVWVGIAQSAWLNGLKESVEKAVSVLDLPVDDRPFRPHLTLGRVKHLKDSSNLIEDIKNKQNSMWDQQEVDRVILYKSKLTSAGAVYSVLESFILATKE